MSLFPAPLLLVTESINNWAFENGPKPIARLFFQKNTTSNPGLQTKNLNFRLLAKMR